MLLDSGHYASEEVKEKITLLAEEKTTLQSFWEERRIMYEQCMDYQLFYRDMEQADAWMSKQESFLDSEDYGDSLDSVEAMTKKQEDFEKSLLAQEEKIKALDEFASKLIEVDHYAKEDIDQRRTLLLEKRSTLVDKSAKRKVNLQDSFSYHQFDRDITETKSWFSEKLKVAKDENYLDPTNLSGKLQKHQNFDGDLAANKIR